MGDKWTNQEIEKLINLRSKGHTWSYISNSLNRTKESVRIKYKKLITQHPKKYAHLKTQKTKIIDRKGRTLTSWNKNMETELVQLKTCGFPWKEIGKRLNVSPKAAKNKYYSLVKSDSEKMYVENVEERKILETLIDSYRYVVKKLINKNNEETESIFAAEKYLLKTLNKEGFYQLIKTIKNSS